MQKKVHANQVISMLKKDSIFLKYIFVHVGG